MTERERTLKQRGLLARVAASRDASSTGDRRESHTPGPWTVFEIGDAFQIVCCAGDYVVATAHNRKDAEAIAAVPDILAALETLLGANGRKSGYDGYCLWWTNEAEGKDAEATARAARTLSNHQNAPTDDTTGQRSGLSPLRDDNG